MSKEQTLPPIIQRRVNELIRRANPIILERALEKFDKHQQVYLRQKMYRFNAEWHANHPKPAGRDRGCGCDYCVTLAKYVVEKINEHHIRKKMDNWWYEPYSHSNDQTALRNTREKWKYHKAVKDQIKQEIGL